MKNVLAYNHELPLLQFCKQTSTRKVPVYVAGFDLGVLPMAIDQYQLRFINMF
jgi:hypothetical protein